MTPPEYYGGACPERGPWECPECGEVTHSDEWSATEVGCEDCGSHPAAVCPVCDEPVDLIFADPLVTDG